MYLLLHVFIGKEKKLLSKDCLLTQHVLIIHFLHQVRIVDSIRLKEFHVCHLECLAYGLRNQLCLNKHNEVRLGDVKSHLNQYGIYHENACVELVGIVLASENWLK